MSYCGEADEVWVPYGDDGQLVLDGPRYSGDEVPEDVECDCVCNGIDAALEAAGFARWMTAGRLVNVACGDAPLRKRDGMQKGRNRSTRGARYSNALGFALCWILAVVRWKHSEREQLLALVRRRC